MEIINFINNNSNNKYNDLQFYSATFYKDNNLLEVVFNSQNKYTKDEIDYIKQLVLKYVENRCNVEIKIKRLIFSTDICELKIKEVIKNNPIYNTAVDEKNIEVIQKDDNTIIVNLIVDENFDENQKRNFEEYLLQQFSKLCNKQFYFNYKIKSMDYSNILDLRKEEIENDIKNSIVSMYFTIHNQKLYLGKMSDVKTASLIEDIKDSEKGVVVAGKIKNIREIKKQKDDSKEVVYYKFDLHNENSSLDCVCFLKNASDLLNLKDEQQVVVLGDTDNFNGNLSMRVLGVSICSYDEPKLPVKTANKYYKYAKPIPYIATEQMSFLNKIEDTKSEYLLNNSFVVFDLETTGLDTNTCNIIEIGAVKIVQGKITQQFSTFVNPMEHIPDDATKVNNITDDMVKDAPTIEQVFPDFYKFIEGCVLVAHNISYDFPIVNRFGKKLGYTLDNKQEDTLLLSQKYLGQLKHFKLSSVCELLGVSLIGAHRAVNDTVATAKVFIKLIENYQDKQK